MFRESGPWFSSSTHWLKVFSLLANLEHLGLLFQTRGIFSPFSAKICTKTIGLRLSEQSGLSPIEL